MMAIFEEVVDIKKFVCNNVLKGQDLTFLDRSLEMLRQLMMVLENFFRLDDYFFINAKPNRIEGNIIGLIISDIEKLYNFCNSSILLFEDKLVDIEDEEFAFGLFFIYSRFIKFNVRFKRILTKIKDFVDLFSISLPDFHAIDIEKNSKIEKYFLKLKPKISEDKYEIGNFLKNVNLPKNGDLAHFDKDDDLLHQNFFTEIADSEEEFMGKIELEETTKFNDLKVKIKVKKEEKKFEEHNTGKYELSEVEDDADEEEFEI